MKAAMESTSQVTMINGTIPARVWEGVTEHGVKFFALVVRVGVHENEDCSQFERELIETKVPSPEVSKVIPLRMVL